MLSPKALRTKTTFERMRPSVGSWLELYLGLTFNYRLELRRYGLESELV